MKNIDGKRFLGNTKKYWVHWIRLFAYLRKVPKSTFKNPKFVFSTLVIMSISSSGIWIPWFFNIDLSMVCNIEVTSDAAQRTFAKESDPVTFAQGVFSDSCNYMNHVDTKLLQNFSIFMFNLGILGGIAAEYFIRSKFETADFDNAVMLDEYHVKEYAGYFCWFVALVLSFAGLREPMGSNVLVIIASWLSVSLWVCTNLTRKEYEIGDAKSVLGLNDDIGPTIKGSGLKEESSGRVSGIQGGGLI